MDIHLSLLVDAERALVEEKRANDARRAFMKFIFHEVRTPLNSLTMGIDMIASSPNIDASDVESLEIMRSASSFMSKTLDGVLSIHKIEEGKFELELGPTRLEPLVQSTVLTFKGTIVRKGLDVRVSASPHVPDCVVADALRIEHVVSNLLSNAIKFSPQGGAITVFVDCLSSEPKIENGIVVGEVANISISISDEGPGISKEDQAFLFNQFMQIRPVTMQAGQGSGLGLAFCKNIVTLHKGEISVLSSLGKGTTFRFIIPYLVVNDDQSSHDSTEAALSGESSVATHASSTSATSVPLPLTGAPDAALVPVLPVLPSTPASASAPSGLPSVSSIPSGFSSQRDDLEILVVDDADSNRKILMLLLQRKKLKCFGAEDGRAAVDLIAVNPHRFKLVLMDNLMPVMRGTEASQELRLTSFPYLVVGVTGNVTESDVDEYLKFGADAVLRKPIKGDVIDKLLEFIDANGTQSQWYDAKTMVADKNGTFSWEQTVKRTHSEDD